MANQEQSERQSQSGKPRNDSDRGNAATGDRDYRGDGPGKIGVTSDNQPDLVAPSGVNERDRGAADEAPNAGDMLNFDDDEVMSGTGKNQRTGGTWSAQGGDSGKIAPPSEVMSDRNGPSDPDRGGERKGS